MRSNNNNKSGLNLPGNIIVVVFWEVSKLVVTIRNIIGYGPENLGDRG